jgi:hypothetical protein
MRHTPGRVRHTRVGARHTRVGVRHTPGVGAPHAGGGAAWDDGDVRTGAMRMSRSGRPCKEA